MPRLFRGAAVATENYGYPTRTRRRHDAPERTARPRPKPPPAFATAEKRRSAGRIGSVPQAVVAQPFHRVLHRLSTNDFNGLSPGNFLAALLFPCPTRGGPANLSLPQRIARHRAGRKGLRVASRGKVGLRSGSERNGHRNVGGSGKVFGPDAVAVSQGLERAADGLRIGGGGGGSMNRRKLVEKPGNGWTSSGRRQGVSQGTCEDRV